MKQLKTLDPQIYSCMPKVHRDLKVISIQFAYVHQHVDYLRKRFPSAKWSRSQRFWYLPDLPVVRRELGIAHKPALEKWLVDVHPINHMAVHGFYDQLLLKAYSTNTLRMYLSEFRELLLLLEDHPVDQLTAQRLKSYFLYCVDQLEMGERKMNGKINAIKFYLEKVLHQPKMFFDIPRPKKPSTLPKMLSTAEVRKIFKQIKNLKHMVAIQLVYGMGLRVSEVVNIKVEHIDSDRMMVHIVGAKGKKDRYVPLPKSILPLLREYYRNYKPKEFILEGQYGGRYSVSSVQNIFKRAMERSGIKKRVGIHGLRHSYATHLLESGADIRFIQELLGHHSLKTTQIYTKVTQTSIAAVVSPLDHLKLT